MTIKSFERPLIEISDALVFKQAKLIDNEYKLDIRELSADDRISLLTKFLSINNNLDRVMQEYIDDACSNRLCAESDIRSWYDDE